MICYYWTGVTYVRHDGPITVSGRCMRLSDGTHIRPETIIALFDDSVSPPKLTRDDTVVADIQQNRDFVDCSYPPLPDLYIDLHENIRRGSDGEIVMRGPNIDHETLEFPVDDVDFLVDMDIPF